jgi:hypothetical protein
MNPTRSAGARSRDEPSRFSAPDFSLASRELPYRRNRRQQRKAGGDRRSECADETIPGDFEVSELVQQDEVTPRGDVALHRGRSGNGADSIKVTHSHARPKIVKDRKSCPRREVPQIAGLTMPIGEIVVLCDEPGQTYIWQPLIRQCSKDGLNLNIRCAPDHGDNFCRVFHDNL